MATWQARPNGDPLHWLLDGLEPAVRHRALRELLDKPADDAEVVAARAAAMASDPIASILRDQDGEGWWIKPGGGYSTRDAGGPAGS